MLPLTLLAGLASAQGTGASELAELATGNAEQASRNVALVVGLSYYQHLPDEVELHFARSDAAKVAAALREGAHFDEVILLTDKEASKDRIRDVLRKDLAQVSGANDLLVVYFAGHGMGADLGEPTLLAHDSTLAGSHMDGLPILSFAEDLQTWVTAKRMLFVTDAIHANTLDGIPFYGPAASEWPPLRMGTVILSASRASEPGTDGRFGPVFADAVSGAADTNADTNITAEELFGYLVGRLERLGQVPGVGGNFDRNMALFTGITPGALARSEDGATRIVRSDLKVWSAKFIFDGVTGGRVTCTERPVVVCDPSCYVRDFPAGACALEALHDGRVVRGEAVAMSPGAYRCTVDAAGSLRCEDPRYTGQ